MTTVGLWIDHRKAVIVFVTDRDEEIKLINLNVEKQHRQSGVPSRQTIYSRGAEEETAISIAAERPPEKRIGVPVIVTTSKLEAASLPVVVGLTALRVLPNFTLATERATRTIEMRT